VVQVPVVHLLVVSIRFYALEAMTLNVSFKLNGSGEGSVIKIKKILELDPSLTIMDVKGRLTKTFNVEPDRMKFIYKGRILKDTETLVSSKVESGHTICVVKGAASAPAATPGATSTTVGASAASSVDGSTAPAGNMAAPGGAGGDHLMEFLGEAVNSTDFTMDSNDLMAGMMQDPAMQTAMQMTGGMGGTSPAGGMAAMMQNPAMMQAAMQMMGGMGGTPAADGNPLAGMDPAMQMHFIDLVNAEHLRRAMMQDPTMMQAPSGMGGTSPAPARCACGNFESGRGDGLCNTCRNSRSTQSPP